MLDQVYLGSETDEGMGPTVVGKAVQNGFESQVERVKISTRARF